MTATIVSNAAGKQCRGDECPSWTGEAGELLSDDGMLPSCLSSRAPVRAPVSRDFHNLRGPARPAAVLQTAGFIRRRPRRRRTEQCLSLVFSHPLSLSLSLPLFLSLPFFCRRRRRRRRRRRFVSSPPPRNSPQRRASRGVTRRRGERRARARREADIAREWPSIKMMLSLRES